MGIYDIAMLIIFGGAIYFGYWKGLAWQIASVAALIVSYIVAVNFRDQVAPFIQVDPPWNRIGAMLVLFLGSSLIIWTIYASVAKSLKKNQLKGFDRQAGALLGAVKGVLLCMVVTMFSVSFLGENAHNSIDNSTLGPYVEKGIWQVSAFVPAELARFVDPHIESYKQAAGHGEPEVNKINPNDLLQKVLGTTYSLEQPISQDLSKLPPSDQPQFQNSGYPGTFQTSVSNSGFGNNQQPATNQNYQFGTSYGAPPPKNQTSNWNQGFSTGGYQGGFLPSASNADGSSFRISDASRKILDDVRQQGINRGLEAANQTARQFLEGGQVSNTRISEVAQQILEDAGRRGINMSFEAANEAARKWLQGGQ